MKFFVVTAVTALMLAAPASATIVQNGSFEVDAGSVATDGQLFGELTGGTGGNSWSVFNSLPGWTTVSGAGIEIQTDVTLTTIDPDPSAGAHYVELDSNNNTRMRQLVNFTSTGSYLFSFLYSPRDGNAGSNTIDYSLIGSSSPFANLLSGSVTGPSVIPPVTAVGTWTEITVRFVVTQVGSYNLDFAANGTSNSLGGFVDRVAIVAVPVPAAGFLLLAGLGGLAALRRRKVA